MKTIRTLLPAVMLGAALLCRPASAQITLVVPQSQQSRVYDSTQVVAEGNPEVEPIAVTPGTEYYVAYMQNEDNRLSAFRSLMLQITSQVATTGYVEVPGAGVLPFSTQPGQVTSLTVPSTLEMRTSEEVTKGGIHIVSRAPVSVYVVNARYQSDGVYPALPINNWGRRYLTMNMPNADGERSGEFLVIAGYDSTQITIRPTVNTYRTNAGHEISKYLNKGETFLVQAQPGSGADLTGSEVIASRPVGLISGHMRTPVVLDNAPIDITTYSMQMICMELPDSSWGKDYITVPQRATGDRFRLMPSQDGTRIVITHFIGGVSEHDTLVLQRGEVADVMSINGKAITGTVLWQANKPLMLVQYRTGGAFGSPDQAPAMLPAISLEHAGTHSVFIAPVDFAGDVFTQQTFTIVAKGDPSVAATDPANPLRSVMLDGTPLHQTAPALLTQRIGTTEYYFASIPIASGSHTISARSGYPVTGIATGSNGGVARDNYTWTIPFWMQPIEADVSAPYVAATIPGTPKGIVTVKISDRTATYFSGVSNVAVLSSGWQLVSFSTPNPDDDATAMFRATSDPSGPLMVTLTDRDNNAMKVKLHDGVCFKTANADKSSLTIDAGQGQVRQGMITLAANPCGDQATVKGAMFTSGNIGSYVDVAFQGSASTSTIIPASGSANLIVTTKATTPQGTYQGDLAITVDDSVIVVPVTLNVGPPSGVSTEAEATNGSVTVAPNPVTTGGADITVELRRTGTVRVSIATPQGKTVAVLHDNQLTAGEHTFRWNAADAVNGVYFCRVQTPDGILVKNIIVVK